MAFYDLGGNVGDRHMTLWQGEFYELFTFTFASLEESLNAFASFKITESREGIVLDLSGYVVNKEELIVTLATPDDPVGRSVAVEVYPLHLYQELRPTWSGDAGRWGEFYLLGDAAEEGIQFVSDTAVAMFVPTSDGPPVLADYEAVLMEELRVAWMAADRPAPGTGSFW